MSQSTEETLQEDHAQANAIQNLNENDGGDPDPDEADDSLRFKYSIGIDWLLSFLDR